MRATGRPNFIGWVTAEAENDQAFVSVYTHASDHERKTLRIESARGTVRAMLVLDRQQTIDLARCLGEALASWEKQPE